MNEATKDLVDVLIDAQVDSHHICGTWLPGLYYGNDWFKEIYKQAYFEKYLIVIKAIMARPDVYVSAVVLKEDHDVVLSYAVFGDEGSTLHWVYTKPSWRRLGLAASIIDPDLVIRLTHLTNTGRSIKKKHEWDFDPFL